VLKRPRIHPFWAREFRVSCPCEAMKFLVAMGGFARFHRTVASRQQRAGEAINQLQHPDRADTILM
jgi:hypothetical protein